MRKNVIFLITPFLLIGCATSRNSYLTFDSIGKGCDILGNKIYLEPFTELSVSIDKFLSSAYVDENGKIDFLLSSIRHSRYFFIRNGSSFIGDEAASWLRWKSHLPQYDHKPVVTAADFVDHVADGSRKTGLPYVVKLPDGNRHFLRDILHNHLEALEKAIQDRRLEESVVGADLANPTITHVKTQASSVKTV